MLSELQSVFSLFVFVFFLNWVVGVKNDTYDRKPSYQICRYLIYTYLECWSSLQMSAVPKQRAQITEWPSGNQFPQNGGVALAEVTGGEWALVRQVLPGRGETSLMFWQKEGIGGPGQRVVDRPPSVRAASRLTPDRGKAVAGLRGSPVQQAADGQETT